MEQYVKAIKPLGGAEIYKKTPEEKLELKKAKKDHKAWLKNQPKK